MKSKIAEKILAETPEEIREAVKLYGDMKETEQLIKELWSLWESMAENNIG
jgi:hypothetical protein